MSNKLQTRRTFPIQSSRQVLCRYGAMALAVLAFVSCPLAQGAILTPDGDFGAQTLGNPVAAPWAPVGGGQTVSAGSQSPFANVFASNGKGTNTPASAGNPYFVGAVSPYAATTLYFNADFRNTTADSGYYSMIIAKDPDANKRMAGIYINGSNLYVEDDLDGLFNVTNSLAQNTWYNVQLTLDTVGKTYSGTLTPYGGSAIAIPTQSFIKDFPIDTIYTDGGTPEGLGLFAGGTDPTHDIDNFVLSDAPLAAPVPVLYNANTALKSFETSNSGTVNGTNGVWQYGTAPSLAGVPDSANFTPFSAAEHNDTIVLPGIPAGDLQGWQEDTGGDLVPAVAVNVTAGSTVSGCCGTYDLEEMWLHGGAPASGRDFAIVRWTAPSDGLLNYSGNFINESGNAGAASYVMINGVAHFIGAAAGTDAASGTITPAFTSFMISAGTTVDFAVRDYKSTGLYASITFTPVPEPASVAIAVVGCIGAVLIRRRRKSL